MRMLEILCERLRFLSSQLDRYETLNPLSGLETNEMDHDSRNYYKQNSKILTLWEHGMMNWRGSTLRFPLIVSKSLQKSISKQKRNVLDRLQFYEFWFNAEQWLIWGSKSPGGLYNGFWTISCLMARFRPKIGPNWSKVTQFLTWGPLKSRFHLGAPPRSPRVPPPLS